MLRGHFPVSRNLISAASTASAISSKDGRAAGSGGDGFAWVSGELRNKPEDAEVVVDSSGCGVSLDWVRIFKKTITDFI